MSNNDTMDCASDKLVQRSEHDAKYDRQMRLWGGHGQKRLEHAHVLCLGSGPTASECLKNLVLPNVGEFTIVDSVVTSDADVGNNFFVELESIGKPRAQVVKELLLEMNPEVKGNDLLQGVDDFTAAATAADIKKFTIVLASCLCQGTLAKIAELCTQADVPLISLRSYGFIGSARLQVREHTVVESHFDNDRYDLFCHLDQLEHFPELASFLQSFQQDEAKMDSYEHSHIPYVSILAAAAERWRSEHKSLPSTHKEKQAFKDQIEKSSRDYDNETNYQEAVKFAFRAYMRPELDHFTQAVLQDDKAKNITATSKPFWVFCAAMNRFLATEGHGSMPCSTSVPDMNCQTQDYIKLKQIFAAKAAADMDAVLRHVQCVVQEVGGNASNYSREEAEYFVKNCRGLRCIRTRSLADELDPARFNTEEITEHMEDYVEPDPDAELQPPRMAHWYFALRTADVFHAKCGRYPGVGGDPEQDAREMVPLQQALLQDVQLTNDMEVSLECLQAIARCGAREIHNTSAFIGGVGAQVILKVILQQYVPVNNTLIFNGIHGACATFCL